MGFSFKKVFKKSEASGPQLLEEVDGFEAPAAQEACFRIWFFGARERCRACRPRRSMASLSPRHSMTLASPSPFEGKFAAGRAAADERRSVSHHAAALAVPSFEGAQPFPFDQTERCRPFRRSTRSPWRAGRQDPTFPLPGAGGQQRTAAYPVRSRERQRTGEQGVPPA